MNDYIKREDALQDIDNAHANTITQRGYKDYWSADLETQLVCGGLAKAIEVILDTPSADVVEVVRCKDCKYWQDQEEGIVEVPICARIQSASEENPLVMIIGEDGYCSYGERTEQC